MILVLGGTTEAAHVVRALSAAGIGLLTATRTDAPWSGDIRAAVRLCGELDGPALEALIRTHRVRAVADATHPYAARISVLAHQVCARMGVPYIPYWRPGLPSRLPGAYRAGDHQSAAHLACRTGRRVLLTVGAHHLAPYMDAARRTGCRLLVRLWDTPANRSAAASWPAAVHLWWSTPTATEQWEPFLARHRVDTVVTKDTGEPGGANRKYAAARRMGCTTVVVCRPASPQRDGWCRLDPYIRHLVAAACR